MGRPRVRRFQKDYKCFCLSACKVLECHLHPHPSLPLCASFPQQGHAFFLPRLVDPFTAFWSKNPLCRFKVTQQGSPDSLACLDVAGPLPSISPSLSSMPAERFSAELICFTCLRFLPCRTLSSIWIESLGFRRLLRREEERPRRAYLAHVMAFSNLP